MWQRRLSGIIALLALSGCTFNKVQEAAPVVDMNYHQSQSSQGYHVVRKGETLYEIAWRYDKDYRELATANGIAVPYVIYPGQKILLKEKTFSEKNVNSQKSHFATAGAYVKKNNQKPPSLLVEFGETKTEKDKTTGHKNAALNQAWQWPAQGKIISHFSQQHVGSKGIDIAGKLGDKINAASKGKVVYSGSGLRGYGQLIIIKHNDSYLSAYGHNSRLLVKEGEIIETGQPIAEMGTDGNQAKLHFEIRKNGHPINPLKILPGKV
ncbi:MAG: peptidoglycan DD-metalloendopeptidase family protein [Proteobacteria bacterium]|nr:peptidoglycan DD-metalloendopeptidase family protein [Pseudomonadota bacterium]